MESPEKLAPVKEGAKQEYIDLVVKRLPVDERVDINEFLDIDHEEVIKDRTWVAQEDERQRRARAERSKETLGMKVESERFEAGVVVHIANRYKWFGKDAHVTRASEFDDKRNKTDAYLEIMVHGDNSGNDKYSTICLSIDAAQTSSFNEISKKFLRNQEVIKNGGQEIKYFKSYFTKEKGNKKHVMPIILGADAIHARDVFIRANELSILAKTMTEAPTPKVKEMAQTRAAELTIHPMQRLFLEEAIMQYEYHLRLSDQDREYMPARMREQAKNDLAVLKSIKQPVSEGNFSKFENDKVYKYLKEMVNPYQDSTERQEVYSK